VYAFLTMLFLLAGYNDRVIEGGREGGREGDRQRERETERERFMFYVLCPLSSLWLPFASWSCFE